MALHIPKKPPILLIEPFYGGSHKQLMDTLMEGLNNGDGTQSAYLITLSAKKWHWRARTSSLYISQIIPKDHDFKILFASCVLNVAELIALRLDLSHVKKVVYFHENQLVYPIRKEKERDFQYGYNQLLTCIVADIILFNSKYNKDSFLDSISKFFKLQPDFRPKELKQQIAPKCKVLYFPIKFPQLLTCAESNNEILHIVWPHRWEHDKDPEKFFHLLFTLADNGLEFKVSVLGETFSEVPSIFPEARIRLKNQIINWGHLESKEKYYDTLRKSHVAISTAKHEFYGVAMLEATYCGCFPLCPNSLVYPEIYPSECLYKSEQQLLKILEKFCENPKLAIDMRHNLQMDFENFRAENLMIKYRQILSS